MPIAPVSDKAIQHNQNLLGMGGVFNPVNLAVYHYAGNNPVKYIDPDGEEIDSPATRKLSVHEEIVTIQLKLAAWGLFFKIYVHRRLR